MRGRGGSSGSGLRGILCRGRCRVSAGAASHEASSVFTHEIASELVSVVSTVRLAGGGVEGESQEESEIKGFHWFCLGVFDWRMKRKIIRERGAVEC